MKNLDDNLKKIIGLAFKHCRPDTEHYLSLYLMKLMSKKFDHARMAGCEHAITSLSLQEEIDEFEIFLFNLKNEVK